MLHFLNRVFTCNSNNGFLIYFEFKCLSLCYFSSAQELEKDINNAATESLSADKKLAMFDKLFAAYHEARICIRSDLVRTWCYLDNHIVFLTISNSHLYTWNDGNLLDRFVVYYLILLIIHES